MSDFVLT